jgi:hypothetical protein
VLEAGVWTEVVRRGLNVAVLAAVEAQALGGLLCCCALPGWTWWRPGRARGCSFDSTTGRSRGSAQAVGTEGFARDRSGAAAERDARRLPPSDPRRSCGAWRPGRPAPRVSPARGSVREPGSPEECERLYGHRPPAEGRRADPPQRLSSEAGPPQRPENPVLSLRRARALARPGAEDAARLLRRVRVAIKRDAKRLAELNHAPWGWRLSARHGSSRDIRLELGVATADPRDEGIHPAQPVVEPRGRVRDWRHLLRDGRLREVRDDGVGAGGRGRDRPCEREPYATSSWLPSRSTEPRAGCG